ncbi:MAG: NAD-dependent epimerase/dehydratase family protein [Actinobacteria bacterium]|nr:NAD-dependent epimerase/dehydratase family protein [Actinomycetota bacterium]
MSHYYDPEPLPKAGELARALQARGHDVRVVTGLPTYPAGRLYPGHRLGLRQRTVLGGVPVTRTFEVPYHGRSPVGRAANYASTLLSLPLGWPRGWRPDAVYVWAPPPTTVFAARLLAHAGRMGRRRGPRPRVVLDVQDLWPDFGLLAGLLHEGRAVRAMRRVEARAYAAADRIVVPTEGYRRAVLARGTDPGVVEVLSNWIPDDDAVPPDPREVAATRTAEGWDDRFVVLFAGNLGNAQGLEAVVATAAGSDPDVVWAFAGDGTERAALEAQAAAAGLGDRVRFLGRRPPSSMPTLAGAADVLLVHLRPSPLAEVVVPTKLNGYLAYGRPILCALGGEGADLLERAGAGVSVAPGDPAALLDGVARLRALADEERAELGRRGRAFARAELVRSALVGRYEAALGIAPPAATSEAPGDDPSASSSASAATVTTDADRARWTELAGGPLAGWGTVLVTGATGSIGPRVVAALREAGVAVRVLVRDPTGAPEGVEAVVGDLRDPVAVNAAVAGCRGVIHLAAVVHQRGAEADAAQREVTDRAARTLFAAAEAAGCERVVLASSIAVYGPDGELHEGSPLQPATAYAEAKVAAEADMRRRVSPSGAPLGVVVRLATCYGPGAGGNVTAMLRALRRSRFAIVGSGTNRKTLLHVDDAARSLVLALLHPAAAGGTFDASDGHPLPLRDVARALTDALGRPRTPHVPAAPVDLAVRGLAAAAALAGRSSPVDPRLVHVLQSDVSVPAERIRRELGFAPRYDLAGGVRTVLAAEQSTRPAVGQR